MIIAVTGALGGGQDQTTTSTQGYIAQMDNLQRQYLLEADKLSIGKLTEDGELGRSITRANGDPIQSQGDLEEAYAAGEFVIYYNGIEKSIAQKPGTEKLRLITNGCFANQYWSQLFLFMDLSATGLQADYLKRNDQKNKLLKIVSTSNDVYFESILGTTITVPECTAIKYCNSDNGIPLNKNEASLLQSTCISNPSLMNNMTLETYDYELVFDDTGGVTPEANEILVNTETGTITGISFTRVVGEEDCVDNVTDWGGGLEDPYCCNNAECCDDWVALDYTGLCVEGCSSFSCDADTCSKHSWESGEDTGEYCINKEIKEFSTTIDFFHWD